MFFVLFFSIHIRLGSSNNNVRIVLALWRARTPSPDQKAQIVEEEEEDEILEDPRYLMNAEDVTMSKAYSAELPVNVKKLFPLFF